MTWSRYAPAPTNQFDPAAVINSPAFAPAVLRAIQDPRIAGYLVPRSIPQRAVDIPLVTDLPVNPHDGDECYYLADSTNGVVWHLRFRAGAPSSYRWEAVGAQVPLHDETDPGQSTTSTSFTDLATAGPGILLPLDGDYDVTVGAIITTATAGDGGMMSPETSTTAATDLRAARRQGSAAFSSAVRTKRMTGQNAGEFVIAKYRSIGGNSATFAHRYLRVAPIRVGRVN